MVLEILSVSIRSDQDIEGILVDKEDIIPIFLYRASLSCVDKEFMNDVNKIIF